MDRQSLLKKLLIDNKPTWTRFLRQKKQEERERKKKEKQIQVETSLQMNKPIEVIDLDQEKKQDNKGDLQMQTCEVFVEEAPKELFLCSESDEIQNTMEDEEISRESGPSNLLPIRQTRSSSTKTAGEYFDRGLDTLISKRREMKSKTNLIVGCEKCWGEYTAEYFPTHRCGEKKYPCKFCSAVLDSFSQNRKHVNTNHYFKDADDDRDNDRMGYRCVLCREWFLSTAYYKTHLIEGSACRLEPLVFCRHCDYKTLTAGGLDSHCVQEHFDLGYEAKSP